MSPSVTRFVPLVPPSSRRFIFLISFNSNRLRVAGCDPGRPQCVLSTYLLWWGLQSPVDSPSELCLECADAADTELP